MLVVIVFYLYFYNCKFHLTFRLTRYIVNSLPCSVLLFLCLQVEMGNLRSAYASLVRHKNRIMAQRLWYVVLEQFLMKYVWSGTGMVMISLPIIMSSLHSNGQFSIIFSFSTTVYPQCFSSDLTNAIQSLLNTVQLFH